MQIHPLIIKYVEHLRFIDTSNDDLKEALYCGKNGFKYTAHTLYSFLTNNGLSQDEIPLIMWEMWTIFFIRYNKETYQVRKRSEDILGLDRAPFVFFDIIT